MAANESWPREVNPSSTTQTRRSPKLEFTIVNDIPENGDRQRQTDMTFHQHTGSSADNFSPLMVPIDPMLASPELAYHMMGYQGMPPGYTPSRPFPLPMDYAAPVYNPYIGLALEEHQRMAGLGAAPFPGNPLMFMSGTYRPVANQQYPMYHGHPSRNKPPPPPPPASHMPTARRPQNNSESVADKRGEYERNSQQRDVHRTDSYSDRRIDVPDRTIIRHDYPRPRDQDPHSHSAARHYERERETFNRHDAYDYRALEPTSEFGPRYRHDDRKDPRVEAYRERPRHTEDRYREPVRSNHENLAYRRDIRQRSRSPPVRNSRFDQRPYEPERRHDDYRNDPRLDRRDRSTDLHQTRDEYGRHVDRYDRDLGNERTAMIGRREPGPITERKNDVITSSADKYTAHIPVHGRASNAPVPETLVQKAPKDRPKHYLTNVIAAEKATEVVKMSSPEEGEISLKAQVKSTELAKPLDPRRSSVEKVPEVGSKSQSKDSMTSKTELEPTRMLFCRNIPKSWTEEKLREISGKFGDIVEMNLTHLKSRGIGFIRFYDIRSAITAKNRLDGKSLEEFGTDATLSVHFSKSEEEKNSNINCTMEHHQGTLLVRLAKKEQTHSIKRKLGNIFANYGSIKANHDAAIIGKSGILVEFYDLRHCAAAFYALNGMKMGSLVLRLSLEWDIGNPESREENHDVRSPSAPSTPGFFFDVQGDDKKRRLSSGAVDVEEIIGKDITKPEHDAIVMERVEKFPPDRGDVQTSSQAAAETSTPILLQQMSSLLSSLQKNQAEPPQKKAFKAEPIQKSKNQPKTLQEEPVMLKPVEVPVKTYESAVVSSGGVVSADRMKKAPTLESVQQLAKLLLQQTRNI